MKTHPDDYRIRPMRGDERDALRRVFERAVLELGSVAYTPEQLRAWASAANTPRFDALIDEVRTFVAHRQNDAIGFCGVGADGHVRSLYVAPEHARRGVAGALLTFALHAMRASSGGQFHTEASELSRPVFERAGFVVTEREQVWREGIALTRYRMCLVPAC
ncbi:MAG: GNAT family N-acetyltransferase [Gammaproteobacteria bacterium]|nr:GNAT family N-acetyltransferase [Gammaproteobacteria bacterium]